MAREIVIGVGKLTTSNSSQMVEVTIYPTCVHSSGRTMHHAKKRAGLVRFVPLEYAEKHPNTTVVEKVKVGPTKHRN